MKADEAEKLIATIRGFVDQTHVVNPNTPSRTNDAGPFGRQAPVPLPKSGSKSVAGRSDEQTSRVQSSSPDDSDAGIRTASGNGHPSLNADQIEKLYQLFKSRFIDDAKTDPVLLHLMTTRPEIVVELQPRVVTLDNVGARGRTARLVAAGWFKKSRTGSAVRSELKRTGTDPGTPIYEVLNGFVRDGFLVRDGDGYVEAPNVKVTERTVERT